MILQHILKFSGTTVLAAALGFTSGLAFSIIPLILSLPTNPPNEIKAAMVMFVVFVERFGSSMMTERTTYLSFPDTPMEKWFYVVWLSVVGLVFWLMLHVR